MQDQEQVTVMEECRQQLDKLVRAAGRQLD